MTTRRQALVLDFGGVVTRTLFETHRQTEKALGLASGALTWLGPFEPDTDTLWQAMQNGDLSEREYWATRTTEVARLVGANWREMSEFVRSARGADPQAVIRPEALAAIAMTHSCGIRLGVLSNELDLFYGAEFRNRLPFMTLFHAIVDATYTGILKPDPRAYQAIAADLDVALADCVFVDDQQRNVAGARDAGMQAVHFDVRQPQQSYASALALLGVARQENIYA